MQIILNDLVKQYGDLVAVDVPHLEIPTGQVVGLAGNNGAGKSTLARMLDGTEPFEGERSPGYRVRHAFFAQHQADMPEPADTILESLRRATGDKTDGELRSAPGDHPGLLCVDLFHGYAGGASARRGRAPGHGR